MFHFSWQVLWACKTLVSSVCLKKRYVSPLFAPVCHPPGDSDSESVTIAFWLHLPTQRYIGCHGFTKSLQTQMTQTHIPSFIHFFLMKTQEWKDCYVHRNIGIRGSNAKYETRMKELILNAWRVDSQQALISEPVQQGGAIQTVSRAVLGKYLREGMKCIDIMHFPRHIATVWTWTLCGCFHPPNSSWKKLQCLQGGYPPLIVELV